MAYNIAIGYQASDSITTGIGNTSIGYQALAAEVLGDYSTALGVAALQVQTGVDGEVSNTAVGWQAGSNVTTGIHNTFIGKRAGGRQDANGVTTGSYNTAVGSTSGGVQATAHSTGNNNTSIGYGAGEAIQGAGHSNTYVGSQAGDVGTTAVENTCIGYEADINSATATNQTVIGKGASGLRDNAATLGNSSTMDYLFGGTMVMLKVNTYNLAAGASRNIVLQVGSGNGWVQGKLFVVCSTNNDTEGGVYNVDFSARFITGSTTTDITQTVQHSDRGSGGANEIELNAPSAGTSTITWVLDNDHSQPMDRSTYTVQLFGQYDVIRYVTLS